MDRNGRRPDPAGAAPPGTGTAMMRQAARFRIVLVIGLVFVSIVPVQNLFGIKNLVTPLTQVGAQGGLLSFLLVAGLAFVEALFVVSLYFPGTIVLIGIMVAFAGKPASFLVIASIAAGAGAVAGSLLNYGATFYYYTHVRRLGHRAILDLAQKGFSRFGRYTSLLLSAHPNYLGALYALFGVLRIRLGLTPLVNLVSASTFFLGYFFAIRWIGLSVSEDTIDATAIGAVFLGLYACLVAGFSLRERLRAVRPSP